MSRRTAGRILLLAGTLGLARPVGGGTNVWTSSGPAGASLSVLALDPSDPSTVYAGSAVGGVFKSIDGASTWFPASVGLAERSVTSLAIAPTLPPSLFAATDGGVFKSVNGGANWILLGSPAMTSRVVVIDPQMPSTVYAGGGALYKSVDGGATWRAIGSGLPSNSSILSLAIDPVNPSVLYAGAGGYGLLKSVDGGTTWINRSTGLLVAELVNGIIVDPSNPSTVYAAADGFSQGIFKSTDGGDSWNFSAVGASFSIAMDPANPATLYAATRSGVLKTVDGGGHWVFAGSGITTLVVAITVAPSSTHFASILYAAGGIVFKSLDSAASWKPSAADLVNSAVYSVLVDPFDPSRLWASVGRDGVARSLDGGVSWESPTPLSEAVTSTLAADPLLRGTLYCGGQTFGVFKSLDGGANWFPSGGLPSVFKLAFDGLQPPTLYAGTANGLYKSSDRGADWTYLGTLPHEVLGVAIDPSNASVIYAGTFDAGVFKSVDGGQSWMEMNNGLTFPNMGDLIVDPQSPSTLLAATRSGGIFKTTNGAATWTASSTGLTSLDVRGVVWNPAAASTAYAATAAGVFRSIDGGASWVFFGVGLKNRNVRALSIDSTGLGLHAGTLGRGVFDYRIAGEAFYTVPPCRLVDTRNPDGPHGGPALEAGADRSFPFAGQCGIPAGARSLALNVAVTDPTAGPGHLTLFSGDGSLPPTSTINYGAGQTRSANAIVTLGGSGDIQLHCSQSSGTAHLVIDVSGYFQ